MKILIINRYFCEYSAVEALSYRLYEILKRLGHDVYFFATDKKPYFIENYEFSKYFPKDKLSFIEYIKNPISYYWDFEAAKKLEQMIKDIEPDIVHVNQPITMSIFSTLKNFKIPVIWTLHDSAIVCGAYLKMGKKGYCKEFLCKNGFYLNCLFKRCKDNKLEPSFRKMILGFVNYLFNSYQCVNKFITPSDALKEIVLSSSLNLQREKFVVLNNFYDVKENNNGKLLDKNSYFLYVGRLVEEKGVQYLLEALKDLPRDIPCVIAGKGAYENNLKKYAKENNLQNVKFVGYVNYDEIDNLYKNAIATIVSSTCFEVFGMINIESFANRTPVIAFNIGGIPEIIDDNQNGFIVDVKDICKLKEKMLLYWNNPELVIEHGKNGYKKAITKYSEEKYFSQLISVYNEVINEKI